MAGSEDLRRKEGRRKRKINYGKERGTTAAPLGKRPEKDPRSVRG